MNKETRMAIAYAQNFLSFVFLNPIAAGRIRGVFLYGSAARGELEKGSDIDLFFDISEEEDKELEGIGRSSLSKFYSSRDNEKWRLLKFSFPLSLQMGNLEKWELEKSIASEGISLYSRNPESKAPERMVLFIIRLPKQKRSYLSLVRHLFGRTEKEYSGKGFLAGIGGERLSSNVILLPKENQNPMVEFLNKRKIDYRIKEIALL
ncbi:nucleotidyltransferase domain-containing protein [Candidatus Woesearchaeota archaeon]|nr:nucleotidyltransferase domain-containing protein [Candidatus Woesearchaeota archaeon]